MSGRRIEVLGRTDLALGAIVPALSSIRLPLRQRVDVEAYRELVLEVRVHTIAVGGAGSLRVEVWTVAPTEEDPAREFRAPSSLAAIALTSSTSAGTVATAALPAGAGAVVSFYVWAGQGTPAAPIEATVSVALAERSADDGW